MLVNKTGSAMIQMDDVVSAQSLVESLTAQDMFGSSLNLTYAALPNKTRPFNSYIFNSGFFLSLLSPTPFIDMFVTCTQTIEARLHCGKSLD